MYSKTILQSLQKYTAINTNTWNSQITFFINSVFSETMVTVAASSNFDKNVFLKKEKEIIGVERPGNNIIVMILHKRNTK